jgi:hypothetical protein
MSGLPFGRFVIQFADSVAADTDGTLVCPKCPGFDDARFCTIVDATNRIGCFTTLADPTLRLHPSMGITSMAILSPTGPQAAYLPSCSDKADAKIAGAMVKASEATASEKNMTKIGYLLNALVDRFLRRFELHDWPEIMESCFTGHVKKLHQL